jgi:phenylpropionate dioxygenase-like ring-hydroxylating dioxygenase large terminal subunit
MDQFVRNTWYPLAWSRDVARSLSKRRVIGEDIVAYRTEGGAVIALEDACPHKLAPLSIGRLIGDDVECGYHGLKFDCTGRCIRAPGQTRIPPALRARSFPVEEKMGLVWVWMGDPELADRSRVFDLPQYHEAGYSHVEGDALLVEANYLSLADNLCDPSHVAYVHRTTLANASHEDILPSYEVLPDKVVTWRWVIDSPLIPIFQGLKDFGGNVDRWHYYHYYPPGIAVIDFGSSKTGTGAPEGNRDDCIQMYACHFITPVDERTCIDHWLCVRNSPSDPAIDEQLKANLRLAFAEDKGILEAIQRNEERPRAWKPIKLALDASSVRMRHMVDEQLAAESR